MEKDRRKKRKKKHAERTQEPKYWTTNPTTPIPGSFLNACHRKKLKQKLKTNLNFVILSISESCLLLPDEMLELLIPTQKDCLAGCTGRELPSSPSTALGGVTAILPHTQQPGRVRGRYQASREWLIGAKLISRVGVSKPFPSQDSERQPQTNLGPREESAPSCPTWWNKHLAECCLRDSRRDQKPQQEID